MWPINLCHDFRYGKIMYNQLDEFVGRSLRLYGEFSQGEASLFDQIVKPGPSTTRTTTSAIPRTR